MAGKHAILLLKRDHPDFRELIARFIRLMQVIGSAPPAPAPPPVTHPPGRGHMDTRVDGDRIWTPEGHAPIILSGEIMNWWPYEVWTDAARVSFYESAGWKSEATNDTRYRAGGQCGVRYYLDPPGIWAQTEYSVGYFQINICAHGHDFNYWRDARNNARYAAQLYAAGGWQPWTYTATRLGLIGR